MCYILSVPFWAVVFFKWNWVHWFFSACMFIIFISSWWIGLFINKKWPLCLFWLILVWSLLCQICVYLLLLSLGLHLLRISSSVVSLCVFVIISELHFFRQEIIKYFFNSIFQFMSFDWRIETISNQSCYWQVCSHFLYFIVFVGFDSFLILIYLSAQVVRFILSCFFFMVMLIFLFCV
jgi:hypothetical protein